MFGLGFWELAVIFLIAFLVLGPTRLPQLAKSLGKGLRDLRRASEDLRSNIQEPLEEIRRPLQDLRDEIAETVHSVGAQIEKEARQTGADESPELEDRRRQVEELYAASAREDEGPPAPAPPATGPSTDSPSDAAPAAPASFPPPEKT